MNSSDVDAIKARLDIADVVRDYVPLNKMGPHFRALCPFHQERTPSFIVSPHKGIWHCFGCGEGGDIFSFIQKIEGVDFSEALKLLAERAGVTLSRSSHASRNHRQRLFELLHTAARFYHEILLHQPLAEPARRYLQERGAAAKTQSLFQLGYAPPQWDAVQQFLQRSGYTIDEMIAAGIVGATASGRHYDRFRGRLMFPISDVQGRIVAFGGRIVPGVDSGNEGKYINSPETSLYAKRQVVYNLHRAKHALRSAVACIVVEGYMDVVMLTQAGYANVVASSGTAFTPEHIQQLARYTSTLHFAFDGDAAGWKAAQNATDSALAAGMKVATIAFPSDKDPADIALSAPETLSHYLNHPRSLVSLLLEQLRQGKAVAGYTSEEHVRSLLRFISRVANPIHQGEMLQEVAHTLHIPEAKLLTWLTRGEQSAGASSSVSSQTSRIVPEQYLLGLVLSDAAVRRHVFPQIEPDAFLDEAARELYKMLQRLAEQNATFSTMSSDELFRALPPEHHAFAEALRVVSAQQATSASPFNEARQLVQLLKRRLLERRLQTLQQQLSQALQSDRSQLLQQFQSVAEALEQVRAQQ